MRNLKYAAVAIFAATVLNSCSEQTPAKLVEGKWKFDNLETASASAADKEFLKAVVEEMKKSTSCDYNSNGEVVRSTMSIGGDPKVEKGTWKLSEDGKKLTTVLQGKEEVGDVVELNENKFTVKSKDETGNFTTFYYVK